VALVIQNYCQVHCSAIRKNAETEIGKTGIVVVNAIFYFSIKNALLTVFWHIFNVLTFLFVKTLNGQCKMMEI